MRSSSPSMSPRARWRTTSRRGCWSVARESHSRWGTRRGVDTFVLAVTRRHLLMLLALSAIWGSSFMFIKVGVRELEPSTLVAGRLVLAALTLLVIVKARTPLSTATAQIRGNLPAFLFVALLNSVVPFWLLAWGETRIDSGLAALLQACAPLFTALLAVLFFRAERVSGDRLVGVLVGFGGVALLVGAAPSGSVLGALAIVATGF